MTEAEFKYDVFISYSHKDEVWMVNNLLPVLENAGLKVCIDYRDFDAGKPSTVNMEDAIDRSRHTVLILTPNWTGSEWTDFEAVLTQTDDPVGRRQKLIPMLLEKCDPPKRVRSLTYVDFMRSDRLDNAWKQLFKALGKPDALIPTSVASAPATGSRDTWHLAHPYPMPPNFTGRVDERNTLTDWLNKDNENRLFILRALGGFGKSALSWHWLTHDLDSNEWTKVLWWSFYEGDASFEHFIEETLKYLKLDVPQGGRPRVDALLDAMKSQKILLVMDGFERALRAYSSMNAAYQGDEEPLQDEAERDCVDINAEHFVRSICVMPNIKSKILITTRLVPRALEKHGQTLQGCRKEELENLDEDDAVAFFEAQGIWGTGVEIKMVCEPYGYHPLSLRLLSGLILNDLEKPGDISVGMKLEITDDIVQNKHHVLEKSYNSLSTKRQKLMSHIACFRSSIEYTTLKLIFNSSSTLESDLHDLLARGLLHRDFKNRYSLHPIVHRYAYNKLTEVEQREFHTHLREIFSSMVYGQTVEDIWLVIDLYFHTALSGEFEEALNLLQQLPLNQFALDLRMRLIDLFIDLAEGQELETSRVAWLYRKAGITCSRIGQSKRAIGYFKLSIEIYKDLDNSRYIDTILHLCDETIHLGMLKDAETNINSAIEKSVDDVDSAYIAMERGVLLAKLGSYDESQEEFGKALSLLRQGKEENDGSIETLVDKSEMWLLKYRSYPEQQSLQKLRESILKVAELMNDSDIYDYLILIGVYWLIGVMYSRYGQFDEADEYLSRALRLCRKTSFVSMEVKVILEIAYLSYSQQRYDDAIRFSLEALIIAQRCGYVLQGADVNLFLAQYALEQEKDRAKAKEYAEEAKKLATCDGPPYYYKVAYDEAVAMLERLKV